MAIIVSSTTNTTTTTGVASVTTQGVSLVNISTSSYVEPFARAIPLTYQLRGLKPFTKMNAFVDTSASNANVWPCVQLTITGETTPFLDASSYTSTTNNAVLRSLNVVESQGTLQSTYPRGAYQSNFTIGQGETIRYYVTPTQFVAGVVIARERQINSVTLVTETVLHVALVRTFNTTSSYTDNFSTDSHPYTALNGTSFVVGGQVKGDVSGATATIGTVIQQPIGTIVTNSMGNAYGLYIIPVGTLRAGSHQLYFSNSATVGGIDEVTASTGTFTSMGTLNVTTKTTTPVENILTTITVTNTSQKIVNYKDPLANTFVLPQTAQNGAYITSLDLYFKSKNPNETQPIIVQIVETLNGYPTDNILFNATSTLSPDKVVLSTLTTHPATRFYFNGPVFLQPNVEYAFKVLSNSINYTLWIGQVGEQDALKPTTSYTFQPNVGVLFKSQNNSTWQPYQNAAIKFNLNQAKFSANTGTMTLQNVGGKNNQALLTANPFSLTNGSTTVKVHYVDHGLAVGHQCTFYSSTDTQFNTTFNVTSVINSDYFTITTTAQTATTSTGGNGVTASKNIKYDALIIDPSSMYRVSTNTGVNTTFFGATATTKDTASVSIPMNQLQPLTTGPRYILSDKNEATYLGGSKSLDVKVNLTSTDNNLSPVFNINALNAMLISNKINTPSTSDNTVADAQTLVSALAAVTFTATTNVITIPTSVDITMFQVGAMITISGTTNNNITTKITNVDHSVSPYAVYVSGALTTESPASTTIVQALGYVDEIAPRGGTAESKYQTTPITITNPATGLNITFDAAVPTGSSIQLYYRSIISTANKNIKDAVWVPVPMSYTNSDTMLVQTYQLNALSSFDTVQFKIVMLSTSTTVYPLIRNFRAICLA